jgi:hypothetical protein
MWGQPPKPALSEVEGAVRRVQLGQVLTVWGPGLLAGHGEQSPASLA